MIEDLDTLLRQPLPEIPDNGFSASTMARVEDAKDREFLLSWIAVGVAIMVVLPFLPIGAMIAPLGPALTGLATQPGLYIAAGIIALTLFADRELAQN